MNFDLIERLFFSMIVVGFLGLIVAVILLFLGR